LKAGKLLSTGWKRLWEEEIVILFTVPFKYVLRTMRKIMNNFSEGSWSPNLMEKYAI
jgi:hypothetical protein